MGRSKKVTVVLAADLLKRAQDASGEGVTPTIRRGLELVAARGAYGRIRKMKGRVRLDWDIDRLREDR